MPVSITHQPWTAANSHLPKLYDITALFYWMNFHFRCVLMVIKSQSEPYFSFAQGGFNNNKNTMEVDIFDWRKDTSVWLGKGKFPLQCSGGQILYFIT